MTSFKSNRNKIKQSGILDDDSKEPKTPFLVLKQEISLKDAKLKTKFADKKKNIKSYELGN